MINSKAFPPIFVISLATNKLRRQHIDRELDKRQLPYQIIDAVDGALLDDKAINEVYSEKLATNNFKGALSKGEIGCALSHLSVYRKILNDNIERAIILEDDALIGDNFVNVIKNINKIEPKSWQLILLGYNENEKGCFGTYSVRVSKPNKSLNFSIRKPLGLACNTHAYLISQQGAKHLIKLTQPLYQPIDNYTADAKLVDVYYVKPRCARVNFKLQSTISPRTKPIKTHTGMARLLRSILPPFLYTVRAKPIKKHTSISAMAGIARLLRPILPPFLYTAALAFYKLFKYPVLIILYHAKFYK